MVRAYTDKELLDKVQTLDSFKDFPKGYWILAVRSKADKPNKFDDKFYIYKGTDFITVTTGTTNPGTSILRGGFKRYNKVGAAVVKSQEWYYDIYKYGLHRGKMPALRQRSSKPILYYRDGDMDGKSEEIGKVQSGVIYTNFHGSTYSKGSLLERDNINGWSAGCLVCNKNADYEALIKMFKDSKQKYFSVCLIKEF
tara:strand:+ start:716 stop:1306 length:591 start_codon:yes stop_codon:yes gene_type:complete